MKESFTIRTALLIGSVIFVSVPALHGLPPFAQTYAEDHPTLPEFESGTFFPALSGTGFALIANSQRDLQPGETYPIPTLSRFDDAGDQLYSVFMDNGGSALDQELTFARDDSSKLFAGFLGDDGNAHLGLYNGSPLAADYSVKTPLLVDQDDAGLTFFPGQFATLVQERGDSVRALVLDSAGQPMFEKEYSSAELLGVEIQGLSLQTAKLEQVPDQSGWFLSIHWNQLNLGDPFNVTYNNRFFLLRLDNAGDMVWRKAFDLESRSLVQDMSQPASNNSYLYHLADTELDLGAGTQTIVTYMIKIASDGTLGFSKQIENVRVTSVFPTPGGVDLYLGGLKSDPANPVASDVAFLRVNAATGSLVDEVAIDQGPLETGSLAGVTDNHVYGVLLSSQNPDFSDAEIELVRFGRSLGNPSTVKYSGEALFAALFAVDDDELVFSPFDGNANTVGAFALDGAFGPLAVGCDLFDVSAANTSDPNLTMSDQALVLEIPAFDCTSDLTALTPTDIPLTELSFQIVNCGREIARLQIRFFQVAGGDIKLAFATQTGFLYDVLFTPDLSEPFQVAGTVVGTDNEECFQEPPHASGVGFYKVVERAIIP